MMVQRPAELVLHANPPQSFSDIELRLLPDETKPIDKNIENLAKALCLFGIAILSSCEGHWPQSEKSSVPWVMISKKESNPAAFLRFVKILEQYNQMTSLPWWLEPAPDDGLFQLKPTYSASWSEENLVNHQKNAGVLAQKLFKEAVTNLARK